MGVLKSGLIGLVLAVLASQLYLYSIDDSIEWNATVTVNGHTFKIERMPPHGTVQVTILSTTPDAVDDEFAIATAAGYVHAMDRLMAMLLTRTAARGQLSELLKSDAKLNGVDQYMRTFNFAGTGERYADGLDAYQRARLQAYADGVNEVMKSSQGKLLEMYLTGLDPEPWTVESSMTVAAIMSYVDLAESQYVAEKFLIQSVVDGVDVALLKRLFTPFFDDINDEVISLLKRTKFEHDFLPKGVHFRSSFIPSGTGSNNWVIGSQHTASGHPIAANDPHLEGNRLPAIWYELTVAHARSKAEQKRGESSRLYRSGITLPGFPDIVMGRNNYVSWGFTYGFADQIDFGIYEVKNGQYRDGDTNQMKSFKVRRETVKRKGDTPIELQFFETDCGVLERNSTDLSPLADGVYLLTAFVGHCASPTETKGMHELGLSRSVTDAIAAVKQIGISTNWLLTDIKPNSVNASLVGNIAYQQSASVPKRATPQTSGLVPYIASKPNAKWRGMVHPDELLTTVNPPEGFIVTANNYIQKAGAPIVVNAHMGSARFDRITENIISYSEQTGKKLNAGYQRLMQCDTYSKDAEKYMKLMKAIIARKDGLITQPHTQRTSVMSLWDYKYHPYSKQAPIFADFKHEVLSEVYGKRFFGIRGWDHLGSTHPHQILFSYEDMFHQLIWNAAPEVFGQSTPAANEAARDLMLAAVWNRVMADTPDTPADPEDWRQWNQRQAIYMNNILFAGELPRWMGFDHAISFPGTHDTPCAGQTAVLANGEVKTFVPSWRFISDMSVHEMFTSMPGGVSGRRFSSLYKLGIDDWVVCRYKTMNPPPLSTTVGGTPPPPQPPKAKAK